MKPAFFPRLALEGIRKNRKLYLPYILSCIGVIMMFYILMALSLSPAVIGMKHGSDVAFCLSLGKFVLAFFALLFLFYTNSFLTKRRYKEYGLYSILGMNKKNLSRIVIWESLFVALIGLAGGLTGGIIFSKLAELGLLNMARQSVDFDFNFDPAGILYTVEIFAGIFLLLTIKSVIKVGKCRPVELLQSAHEGERPIKANWVSALLGVLFLGSAYYLAVTIQNPLSALLLFFVAVIMVIIGTYLLFIAGSVALCKLLQKKKSYYYQKKHFVSVASMTYRMKRNGAGLASICILVTMVLVMISSTGSLYFGADNAIRSRFPYDVQIAVYLKDFNYLSDASVESIQDEYNRVFEEYAFTPEGMVTYRTAYASGYRNGSTFTLDPDMDHLTTNYNNVYALYFINQADYNRLMNASLTVDPGEVYLYTLRCDYPADEINVGPVHYSVAGRLDDFPAIGEANDLLFGSLLMVVSDFDAVQPLDSQVADGMTLEYFCGYYSNGDEEKTIAVCDAQCASLKNTLAADENSYSYNAGCLYADREDFYTTFGGLFFLGIILSLVFTFAAAVIIYYKQVSEGYEDQQRFEIMQNVGMTKTDIRQTVNTQVLTVFYAPLIMAGLHLCFAFPFIWKILMLFNLRNLGFVIMITAAAFLAFALFYALIYRITSRNYYAIVSSKLKDPA